MKVLLVGCGKIGKTIAEELAKENHELYLLDKDKDVLTELSTTLDCMAFVGDGNNLEDLISAGAKDCEVIISMCEQDEVNMLACLFAKSINPNLKTIARIRDPKFENSIRNIKDRLSINNIVNPEELTAREIYAILSNPVALKTESFARSRVRYITFKVPADSFLVDKKVMDVSNDINNSVKLMGVERDNETIIVSGDTVIKANDKLTVIGRPIAISSFLQRVGIISKIIKTVAIVGASNTAQYLTKYLTAAKKDIIVIDKDKSKVEAFLEKFPNVHGIYGDATENDLIKEEGIGNADAFISLTGFDESNVMISLYMKSISDNKVVTKVNHIACGDVLDKLDVGSIITPRMITAGQIVTTVRGYHNAAQSAHIESLQKVMNNKAEIMSFIVNKDSAITKMPLKTLKLKNNLLICTIIRDDKVIIPGGNDTIEVGDYVVITSLNRIDRIEGILA